MKDIPGQRERRKSDRRDADARLDELSALYRVASLATTHGDPTAVMQEVVNVVSDAVGSERAMLFLYDLPSNQLVLKADGPDPEVRILLPDAPLLAKAIRSRAPEISNDLSRDSAGRSALIELFGASQMVAAPLIAGEEVLGVLAAINAQSGSFTPADLRLLTIVADRAALTIQNAALITRLERQVRELDGVQRVSTLLASSEDFETVVAEGTRILAEMARCEKLLVLIHDEDNEVLVPRGPGAGLSQKELDGLRIPLSQPSLATTVFRTNTPLISNDAVSDNWVHKEFRERLDVDNVLVVPLASSRRPIGVLALINSSRGYFDDPDLRFTSLLGSRFASVLEGTLARERERQLMHQLREADRTKTEFVSMLAHELRGPMTTVMGFGYTLRDQSESLPEEKKKEVLGIIVRETERLARMVNDLLDVSRMEAGVLSYELEPVSFDELLENIIQIHSSLQAHHIIDIQIENDLPKVLADRDRMSQVLLNLLTNATRYSPNDTTIRLKARRDGDDFVRVSVSDEGIGIPERDRERIFEKFAMLPKPGWVKKGTGLGLFITKGIVDGHGGRLWVDSDFGHGSTFNFTLPIA